MKVVNGGVTSRLSVEEKESTADDGSPSRLSQRFFSCQLLTLEEDFTA